MNLFSKSLAVQALLVFILSFTLIATQLFFQEKETPYADNITYMSVALPLHETGVFEDGNFRNNVLPSGPNNEGMFFAPLYPVFLAGVMHFSEGLRETARCTIEFRKPPLIEKNCTVDLSVLWLAQIILGSLAAVLIWLTAIALFKKPSFAWLTTFLIVTLGTFAYHASVVMAEVLIMPLFYLGSYFLVLAWQKRKLKWAFLTGLCVGALILTKPSFMYLFYFFTVVMLTGGLFHLVKSKNTKPLQLTILSVLGVSLLVGPWVYRNHTKLDHAAVTFGYGPFTLSQRVAYNEMTATEWWVSWIYGIPGEGDSIAKKLFPKETYERWSWEDPKGFYKQGSKVLRAQTLEEAGSHESHLPYLLKNYVMADLPTHIATTFPIIYRGMWVFELWVFIPYIAFLFLLWHCLKTHRYDYILYAIPPWFMLGLHGFSTVNVARYNIILQASLGMALAWGMFALWKMYKSRSN